MPAKAKNAPSKKAVEKEKQKIIEDKTFGLKNKNKSKAVQNYIKSVTQQVSGGRCRNEHEARAETKEQAEKRKLEKQKKLAASLRRTQLAAAQLRVQAEKTQGAATEGGKINVYVDPRDCGGGMDNWDMETLTRAIETKHQAANRNKTDIICKYFLSALENNLYGWRWECVNGEACMYRHALPAGYVLQKKAAAAKPDAATVPLEELIETERAALPSSLPPATKETFFEWLQMRERQLAAGDADDAVASGRGLSGRSYIEKNSALLETDMVAGDSSDDDLISQLRRETRQELDALDKKLIDEAIGHASSAKKKLSENLLKVAESAIDKDVDLESLNAVL